MDRSELLSRMEAGAFRENNGRVLRTINILKEKYVKLSTLPYALPDIDESEIRKCINFLEEEAYIHVRRTDTKDMASISDFAVDNLEAKLSGRGIRLLNGGITDDCVIV